MPTGFSAYPALPWTRSVEGLSSPLYGLKASRYRRGSAFTWHLQGRDSHPHGRSVVKVLFGIATYLSLLAVPKHFYLFRLNESHHREIVPIDCDDCQSRSSIGQEWDALDERKRCDRSFTVNPSQLLPPNSPHDLH